MRIPVVSWKNVEAGVPLVYLDGTLNSRETLVVHARSLGMNSGLLLPIRRYQLSHAFKSM